MDLDPRPLNDTGHDSKDGPDAPSLTRLTTQVSDWLQSFWPLGREEYDASRPTGAPQSAMPHNAAHMAPNDNNPGLNDDMGPMERRSSGNMMPAPAMPPTKPAMPPNNNAMYVPLQERSSNNNDRSTAPPPVLAPSVSSTFLQLASTPSRLLSNISSVFFDRRQSALGGPPGAVRPEAEQDTIAAAMMELHGGHAPPDPSAPPTSELPPPPPSLIRPSISGGKRNSNSLLDDYEETPMETRLRTVPSR